MKKRSSTSDLPLLRDMIRRAGLRSTQARIAILEQLRACDGPMTHSQIASALEPRGFDRTTIYRSLVELSESGLLARMELGDHVWRYELQGGGQPEHLHFLCVDCGRIECLDGTTVEGALAPAVKRAARGAISDVLLKGHCRDCN